MLDAFLALRYLAWGLWALLLGPLKIVETVVVAGPARLVAGLVYEDPYSAVGGGLIGGALALVLYTARAVPGLLAPGTACAVSLATMAYALVAFAAGAAASSPALADRLPALPRRLPFLRLSATGYLGLLLGLAAFANITLAPPEPLAPGQQWRDWCGPPPLTLALGAATAFALLGSLVRVPTPAPPSGPRPVPEHERRKRRERRARQQEQQRHRLYSSESASNSSDFSPFPSARDRS